jgi:hypothetical protein
MQKEFLKHDRSSEQAPASGAIAYSSKLAYYGLKGRVGEGVSAGKRGLAARAVWYFLSSGERLKQL